MHTLGPKYKLLVWPILSHQVIIPGNSNKSRYQSKVSVKQNNDVISELKQRILCQ